MKAKILQPRILFLASAQPMTNRSKARLAAYILSVISLGYESDPGHAAAVSSTFNVTLTVLKQCTFTAPTTIDFGSLGAATLLTTASQQAQTFSVLCSAGTPYTIGFSSANDPSVGSPVHQMKGLLGANLNLIQYTLRDTTAAASNTLPLGGTASVITDVGSGASQTKTLQATIVSPTVAVIPDTYSDTVTMAVTY